MSANPPADETANRTTAAPATSTAPPAAPAAQRPAAQPLNPAALQQQQQRQPSSGGGTSGGRPAAGGAGSSGTSQDDELVPSGDQLQTIAAAIAVNKVATREIIAQILADAVAHTGTVTNLDLVSLAWACYHNGSSRYTTLESTGPGGILHSDLKDIVENRCTLRQFCMFYAKVIFNMGKEQKTPPANWAAKGFKEDSKYAAFDFFAGTLSGAAVSPPGGLKHKPSPEEQKAHALNAKMAILESREQENQYSNRGNLLAMQQVRAPPAAPLITFN